MLTLITGAPGSGKSAAMVDLLTRWSGEGRAIYTFNVPELKVAHLELEDPKQWHQVVPDGAVVVIDEVQDIWPAVAAGQKTPDHIAALNTHRHRGLDFVVITQFPKLVHVNVRAVCGRHIHLRDVGILGRWWYEAPEVFEPSQFRSCPIKKRYSLPKKVFGLYKSASLHVKPIRSFPRSVIVLGVALLALAGLGARAYSSISEKIHPVKPSESLEAMKARSGPAAALPGPVTTQAPGAPLPAAPAASTAPRVVGCVAGPSRCSCFDANGWPIVMDWGTCQKSAAGYGGVVPLAMASGGTARSQPVQTQVVSEVPRLAAAAVGISSGYTPRNPVRDMSTTLGGSGPAHSSHGDADGEVLAWMRQR